MARTMPGEQGKMMFLYTPAYSTTYSEQNPFVNKNSIYETKTISGDLIRETKTDHNKKNKKGWTWRCLRVDISTKRTVQATQGVYATYSK